MHDWRILNCGGRRLWFIRQQRSERSFCGWLICAIGVIIVPELDGMLEERVSWLAEVKAKVIAVGGVSDDCCFQDSHGRAIQGTGNGTGATVTCTAS